MKSVYLLGILLYLLNCSSSPKVEAPVKPPPPDKIIGCESFKTNEDCVNAKEINFTLAYYQYQGSKGDPQVISMSKEESRPQFLKIKSSEEFNSLKKRMVDDSYINSKSLDKLRNDDIIQYIQDEKEGQNQNPVKTATEIKNERYAAEAAAAAAALAQQEGNAKKRSDDPDAIRKMRERLQKDIDAQPYTFEVSCSSFDDSRPELEQCVSKLKPTLKVISEKKVIYNFTNTDFTPSSMSAQLKLPADFTFELTSNTQDSSKLFITLIKKRILKEDSPGKLYISTGKVFTRSGQNIIIKP
jgi:hypothetical protein